MGFGGGGASPPEAQTQVNQSPTINSPQVVNAPQGSATGAKKGAAGTIKTSTQGLASIPAAQNRQGALGDVNGGITIITDPKGMTAPQSVTIKSLLGD